MGDLELVKRCAELMEVEVTFTHHANKFRLGTDKSPFGWYDPLTDDAQAMALVKKLKLDIEPCWDGSEGDWMVSVWATDKNVRVNYTHDENLNRAIVRCVAALPAGGSGG